MLFKNSQTALCSEDGSEQWLILQTRTSREGAQERGHSRVSLAGPLLQERWLHGCIRQQMALSASELKSSSLSTLQPPSWTPQAEGVALQFWGPKMTIWFLSTHP